MQSPEQTMQTLVPARPSALQETTSLHSSSVSYKQRGRHASKRAGRPCPLDLRCSKLRCSRLMYSALQHAGAVRSCPTTTQAGALWATAMLWPSMQWTTSPRSLQVRLSAGVLLMVSAAAIVGPCRVLGEGALRQGLLCASGWSVGKAPAWSLLCMSTVTGMPCSAHGLQARPAARASLERMAHAWCCRSLRSGRGRAETSTGMPARCTLSQSAKSSWNLAESQADAQLPDMCKAPEW